LQTLEVLWLYSAEYRIVGTWRADAVLQCEPFETALAMRRRSVTVPTSDTAFSKSMRSPMAWPTSTESGRSFH